jgi:hypothetical protein
MTRPMRRCVEIFSLLSLASAVLVGCEKPESRREDSAAASDAGASKVSDEPDLEKAVESVGASRPTAGANGAADGPPPAGIFAPGAADKAMPKGAAATLTLGSDGAAPRVQLGPTAKPGTKHAGSIEVATQSDPRQGAIPIALALTLEALKPKADADAGAPTLTAMVAKVTGATINAPGVPPEAAAAVAKLKGSRVDYQVSADGAGSNFHYEASKGVDPAFKEAVQSLSDALMVLALPFPSKPVGAGAYWMVTTRDAVSGIDVVTYRLVKVEKVEGTLVTLNLSTKRYAASPAFDVEGLPPDAPHVMSEFHGGTDGSLTVNAGEAFPKSGQLDSVLAAALGAPDPTTKQRPMVQLQTRITVAF